jgi:hypothetical protein
MYAKTLEILLAIGLVCGAWFYAGHHAVEEYKEAQKIEQAEATKKQQDKYDELAGKYETLRDTRAANAKTIIREVEKVVERPVYRNVCIDDLGVSIANEALSGTGASKSDAAVPDAK